MNSDSQTKNLPSRWSMYVKLTKAKLSLLVLVTTAVGFFLGSTGEIDWLCFAMALIGTALAAGGTSALNQWMEIDPDRAMKRTSKRPMPSEAMSRNEGFIAGALMVVVGVAMVFFLVNPLAGFLTLLSAAVYILVYTPMKVWSTFNTLVGAVSGAIPPMIGWAAAAESLTLGAWLLGGFLFVWQLPHFLALAWLHRDDYERGGFRMLPITDTSGELTSQVVIITSLLLVPLSLMFTIFDVSGLIYATSALILGLLFVAAGFRMYMKRSISSARMVFFASIIYLPVLLCVMVLDRTGPVPDLPIVETVLVDAGQAP